MNSFKCFLFATALPVAVVASNLTAQTTLLHWNFDEASSGTTPTTDYGVSPQVDGRFFGNDAGRTANTPGGHSLGALDAVGDSRVLANYSNANVASLDGKLDNLTAFTVSLWVNMPNDPANLQRLFRAGNTSGFGFRVSDPTSGTTSASNFGLTLDLGGGGASVGGNLDADNKWLFLAATWTAGDAADNIRLYAGTPSSATQLVGTATVAETAIADTGTLDDHLLLGGHPAFSHRASSALFDDFRIYSGGGDAAFVEDIRVANIPEPGTVALLTGLASTALIVIRRRFMGSR